MFSYREINYEDDLDEVLVLLNLNFPTTHSKEAFIWKHIKNPFGRSYGSLAVSGDKIIGVRMFMKWEFKDDLNVFKAIRPVDTCTDKQFRGQGIFNHLNKNGLEALKGSHDLIFNTPNANSLPGNLKMGWNPVPQKIQYQLGLISYAGKILEYKPLTFDEIIYKNSYLSKTCSTNISKAFLDWRYEDKLYRKVLFNNSDLLIYKIQNLKGIRTIIVYDIFGEKENFNKYLFSVCMGEKALGVYFLETQKTENFKFSFRLKRGVQAVVFRDDRYSIVNKINFSLADLEATI